MYILKAKVENENRIGEGKEPRLYKKKMFLLFFVVFEWCDTGRLRKQNVTSAANRTQIDVDKGEQMKTSSADTSVYLVEGCNEKRHVQGIRTTRVFIQQGEWGKNWKCKCIHNGDSLRKKKPLFWSILTIYQKVLKNKFMFFHMLLAVTSYTLCKTNEWIHVNLKRMYLVICS